MQLLRRTTRTLNLTDTGRSFYEHAARILADLDEAREVVAKSSDLQEFEPADRNRWEEQYQNSKALFST